MEPQRPSLLPMPMSARQTLAETNSRQHDLHFSRPQQLPQDVDRLHHLPSADLDSNGNLQGALPIAPTAILTQASSQVTPKRKRGKYSKAKCQQCRKDKKKCTPVDRSWPSKCDHCLQGGFECSESAKTSKKRKDRHSLSLREPPSQTNSTLKDCRVIADWKRMLQRISTEYRLIDTMRRIHLKGDLNDPLRAYNLSRCIVKAISALTIIQVYIIGKHRDSRQEPGLYFRPEPLHDLIHVIDSRVPEHFRENGEVLAAIDAQKRLTNFQFEHDGIDSLDPNWHDSLKSLDTLQEEFFAQNQEILDRYHSLITGRYSIRSMIKHTCPILHDAHAVPLKQTFASLGKRDSLSQTPLHAAITFTETKHLHKFINPIDINAQDVFGRTPLHIACSFLTLLQHKPDGFLWEENDFPQHHAVQTLLTQCTVNINIRDCDGMYAAEYAILNRDHRSLSMFRDLYGAFDPTSEVGTKILQALRAIEGTESIRGPPSELEYTDDENGITVDEGDEATDGEDESEDESEIFDNDDEQSS